MIIIMKYGVTKQEIDAVEEKIRKLGYEPHLMPGVEKTIIAAVGDERGKARLQALESMHGVEDVVPILKPYKLASREVKTENTIINVNNVKIGGEKIVVMAGSRFVWRRGEILGAGPAGKGP